MGKAFVSWSGGKDCCLAFHRARNNGLDVGYLFNMMNENGDRSRSHGLSVKLLKMQAEAMGLSLIQGQATWEAYEEEFSKKLAALRGKGVTDGVFGDIDFDEHREWVERVCKNCGITPHLPLWGSNQDDLADELIDARFKSIIVVTKADLMDKSWLGREFNREFLKELAESTDVTPCGEAGEFHSFVTDGPMFNKSIEITRAEKILRDTHWFLDIREADFRSK